MSLWTRVGRFGRRLLISKRDEKTSKALIAVTMAVVTLLATVVAFLQQDASINAGAAQRAAQSIDAAAGGSQIGAIVRGSSDLAVYRAWFSQLEDANWAYALAAQGSPNYSQGLLDAIVQAQNSLVTWSAQNSALLAPPYYDSTTRVSDFAGYYADTEVAPQVRAALAADIALDANSQWAGRASSYVTVLTLLAVSLFFLGLATTLRSHGRQLFVGTGGLFVLASLLWTVLVAFSPVHVTPPAAVDDVVAARVAYARVVEPGGVLPLSASDHGHFEDALSAANAALGIAPDYAPARLVRAEMNVFYADALFFRAADSVQIKTLLATSRSDYQIYLATNAGDYSAWWNLGWAELLAGDNSAALSSTNSAIDLVPTHFALYLNRALVEVAMGNDGAARADTAKSLEVAAANNLDSNALLFSQAEFDFGRLAQIWPDKSVILNELSRTIREGQVSLAALGKPAPVGSPPEISSSTLVRLLLAPNGNFIPAGYDPAYAFASGANFAGSSANGVRLFVSESVATPIAPSTMVSVRVWRDGTIDYGSSSDVAWAPNAAGSMSFDVLSPYGSAGFPLAPGAYVLEVYLDGNTRATLNWTVSGP